MVSNDPRPTGNAARQGNRDRRVRFANSADIRELPMIEDNVVPPDRRRQTVLPGQDEGSRARRAATDKQPEPEGPILSLDPALAATRRARFRAEASRMQLIEDTSMPDDLAAAEEDYDEPEELYNEEGIPIEPFHLRVEREAGYFDAEGNYLEYRLDAEDTDAWLESIMDEHRQVRADPELAARRRKAVAGGALCSGAMAGGAATAAASAAAEAAAASDGKLKGSRKRGGAAATGEAAAGDEADDADAVEDPDGADGPYDMHMLDDMGAVMEEDERALYQKRLADLLRPGETSLDGLRRLGRVMHGAPNAAAVATRSAAGTGRPPPGGVPTAAAELAGAATAAAATADGSKVEEPVGTGEADNAGGDGGFGGGGGGNGDVQSKSEAAAAAAHGECEDSGGGGAGGDGAATDSMTQMSCGERQRLRKRRRAQQATGGAAAVTAATAMPVLLPPPPPPPPKQQQQRSNRGHVDMEDMRTDADASMPDQPAEVPHAVAAAATAVFRPGDAPPSPPARQSVAMATAAAAARRRVPAGPPPEAVQEARRQFDALTNYANLLLSAGMFDAYSSTREQLLRAAQRVLGMDVVRSLTVAGQRPVDPVALSSPAKTILSATAAAAAAAAGAAPVVPDVDVGHGGDGGNMWGLDVEQGWESADATADAVGQLDGGGGDGDGEQGPAAAGGGGRSVPVDADVDMFGDDGDDGDNGGGGGGGNIGPVSAGAIPDSSAAPAALRLRAQQGQ